jgi:hypothetical protein
VPFGTIFRDKLGKDIFVVAREEPTSFTRNRSVRVWILGVAGSGGQHLQPILFIGLQSVAGG